MPKINGAILAIENAQTNDEATERLIQALSREPSVERNTWLKNQLREGGVLIKTAKRGVKSDFNPAAFAYAIDALKHGEKYEAFIAEMESRFDIKRTKAKTYWSEAKNH